MNTDHPGFRGLGLRRETRLRSAGKAAAVRGFCVAVMTTGAAWWRGSGRFARPGESDQIAPNPGRSHQLQPDPTPSKRWCPRNTRKTRNEAAERCAGEEQRNTRKPRKGRASGPRSRDRSDQIAPNPSRSHQIQPRQTDGAHGIHGTHGKEGPERGAGEEPRNTRNTRKGRASGPRSQGKSDQIQVNRTKSK